MGYSALTCKIHMENADYFQLMKMQNLLSLSAASDNDFCFDNRTVFVLLKLSARLNTTEMYVVQKRIKENIAPRVLKYRSPIKFVNAIKSVLKSRAPPKQKLDGT